MASARRFPGIRPRAEALAAARRRAAARLAGDVHAARDEVAAVKNEVAELKEAHVADLAARAKERANAGEK